MSRKTKTTVTWQSIGERHGLTRFARAVLAEATAEEVLEAVTQTYGPA